MAWAGMIGRSHGIFGLGNSAFGFTEWREDAFFWAEWAKLSHGEAGILIGAGGAIVATYQIWKELPKLNGFDPADCTENQPTRPHKSILR